MRPDFVAHLRGEWPLALAVCMLLVYLPIVLVSGVFYTNQGNVLKKEDPERYWRWVLRFAVLLVVGLVVLIGSYWLS